MKEIPVLTNDGFNENIYARNKLPISIQYAYRYQNDNLSQFATHTMLFKSLGSVSYFLNKSNCSEVTVKH